MDLSLSRKFSAQNGFGPVPQPLPGDPDFELHTILDNLTAAEEAAICQVTPLVHGVKLAHGNIGTQGNTSCVWQKSRLQLVLPNLPWDCYTLVVERVRRPTASRGNTPLRPFKFKRYRIHRALVLLQRTSTLPWAPIEIDGCRVNAWPEEGNLLELPEIPRIPEVNESGQVISSDNPEGGAGSQPSQSNAGLVQNGNDLGPAPLQNALAPEVVFEGTTHMASSSAANSTSAAAATASLEAMVERMRERVRANQNNNRPPLPQGVRLDSGGRQARVRQTHVLPTDGFVKMRTTPYAWARAFPTVFCPCFVNGEWVIPGDITGWKGIRDRVPTFHDWAEWLMWRSDGRPNQHPTFALVLGNEIDRVALQRQGRAAISIDNVDPNLTAEAFLRQWDDTEGQRKIRQRLNIHAGNVRGTDQYWSSRRREFKATSLFSSYLLKRECRIFHTGSLAEFHDPYLRRILSRYVAKVKSDPSLEQFIMQNDASFHEAIHSYKTVVTHFLAAKMELWFILFASKVYDIDHVMATMEFGSCRGAIHFHSLCHTCDTATQRQLDAIMADWADAVHAAVSELDEVVESKYDPIAHADHHPLCPPGKGALQKRFDFLDSVGDTVTKSAFENAMEGSRHSAAHRLATVLEGEYGINAMHPGVAPTEWCKPGGQARHGYRTSHEGMIGREEVLQQSELRKFKFCREFNLHE